MVCMCQSSARSSFYSPNLVQNWIYASLRFETESEIGMSESSFQDKVQDLNFLSLNFNIRTDPWTFWVSLWRLCPRLEISKSQNQDQIQDKRISWDQDRVQYFESTFGFLGARAPIGIACLSLSLSGIKKFQNSNNLPSPASTCTLVRDSPR